MKTTNSKSYLNKVYILDFKRNLRKAMFHLLINIPKWRILHNKINVFVIFKSIMKMSVPIRINLCKNIKLVINVRNISKSLTSFFINDFNCPYKISPILSCQIYFCISAFTYFIQNLKISSNVKSCC